MVTKEVAFENLKKNIEFIKKEKDLAKDADLCKQAGISKGTLSTMRTEGRIPMLYPFFEDLCNFSGYTVDQLLSQDLEQLKSEAMPLIDEAKDQEGKSYVGIYAAYYFNTTPMKGKERREDYESLRYAVLIIYREKDGRYGCIGDFGLNREQQEERYNACIEKRDGDGKPVSYAGVKTFYINKYMGSNIYSGTFRIDDNSIVIQLDSGRDSLTMMLNRINSIRDNRDKYLGGLAAAISVCTGVYAAPVMQVVGISRGILGESPAEIAAMIKLDYPALEVRLEDEKDIYDMIHAIVDGREASSINGFSAYSLTREQEHAILLTAMNRAINRTVSRNLSRTIQITAADEDDWYYMVKRFEEDQS